MQIDFVKLWGAANMAWDDAPNAGEGCQAAARVLEQAFADAVEECALACEDEQVDAEATGDRGVTYNQACEDCAASIRALTASEGG